MANSTGYKDLDTLLGGGGYPSQSIVTILGGPENKSLGLSAIAAAHKIDQRGVYLNCSEEGVNSTLAHSLGVDLKEFFSFSNLFLPDCYESVEVWIRRAITEDVRVVVVDSLESLPNSRSILSRFIQYLPNLLLDLVGRPTTVILLSGRYDEGPVYTDPAALMYASSIRLGTESTSEGLSVRVLKSREGLHGMDIILGSPAPPEIPQEPPKTILDRLLSA